MIDKTDRALAWLMVLTALCGISWCVYGAFFVRFPEPLLGAIAFGAFLMASVVFATFFHMYLPTTLLGKEPEHNPLGVWRGWAKSLCRKDHPVTSRLLAFLALNFWALVFRVLCSEVLPWVSQGMEGHGVLVGSLSTTATVLGIAALVASALLAMGSLSWLLFGGSITADKGAK